MIKHHPTNRYERLKLKEIHETEKRKAASARRRLKEYLKEQEAERELLEIKDGRAADLLE